MKQLITFLLAICLVGPLAAQKAPAAAAKSNEVLSLTETAYNFGKIQQGRPVTHDFVVVNKGKAPLLIESVQASCGCTTPEWSEAPVMPGASTKITVGFNAASEGLFSKTISVIYNNSLVRTLTISGEVFPAPATSAPLNPSLSYIK